jgi:short-subunit dehydrogenase
MEFKQKYGPYALVAGASEGLGAAFADALAKRGLNLVLVARRKNLLEELAGTISVKHGIRAVPLVCDLSTQEAAEQIIEATKDKQIHLLVYNAAKPYIGRFIEGSLDLHEEVARVNMITPLRLLHHFGGPMLQEGRGGILLMSSLAGLQGSPYLSTYSATKAFSRILAESLWYEWRIRGVGVTACCAGSIATPNYLNSKPRRIAAMAPRPQDPGSVVAECLAMLGKRPSFVSGRGNRLASFFMQKIFSRIKSVSTMGRTTGRMYGFAENDEHR